MANGLWWRWLLDGCGIEVGAMYLRVIAKAGRLEGARCSCHLAFSTPLHLAVSTTPMSQGLRSLLRQTPSSSIVAPDV